MRTIVILAFLLCASTSFAAGGAFQIYNNKLSFPDGSEFSTAPKDGKTIYNGSGAPVSAATAGDFYLDTANNRLYGPYNGSSWGAGISLAGPQGIQGIQGPQGLPGASSSTQNTLMNYMTKSTSNVIPNVTTTDLTQILSFYGYTGGPGNIYGYNSNIGMQFNSGTTSGLVVFYFLQYLSNGTIDPSFTPIKIAGGRWVSTTINGAPALLVNTASVRYAMPDIYFTALNGNLTAGDIVPGPVATMPQSTAFNNALVSNKTIAVTFPSGTVTAFLASTGFASGTDPSGNSFTNLPWSITGDGRLVLNTIYIKIVGGSANPWTATYTNTKYTVPATELGPITLLIY